MQYLNTQLKRILLADIRKNLNSLVAAFCDRQTNSGCTKDTHTQTYAHNNKTNETKQNTKEQKSRPYNSVPCDSLQAVESDMC